MDPFRDPGLFGAEPGFEKILHGFYIVIRLLFLFLYPLRVFEAEILRYGLPLAAAGQREGEEFLFRKEQEIFYFYQYPVTDQGIFREIFIQMLYLLVVTSVNRRKGGKCV